MAALPEKTDRIRDAIFAAYEKNADNKFRPHLGASQIGADCERSIWYGWHWTTKAAFPGRVLRLFETGNLAEARFVKDLRSIGVTVLDVNPDDGKQWSVGNGFHFGGSMDGACVGVPGAEKTWHVVEFKTHGDKSFTKLRDIGVIMAKPQHYAQMTIYMHLTGMERALYGAVNKNSDDLHYERVKYDMSFALQLIAKADRIIAAPHPPERPYFSKTYYDFKTQAGCKYCDHAELCWEDKLPERNCRTCLHSTAVETGWHCSVHDTLLTVPDQREGCLSQRFNPRLINSTQKDCSFGQAGVVDWISYESGYVDTGPEPKATHGASTASGAAA